MKSRPKVSMALISFLTFSSVLPGYAQRTVPNFTMPRYNPPPVTPRYNPPPVPRSAPSPAPSQSRQATQEQTSSPPQHQVPTTQQRSATPNPAGSTSNRSQSSRDSEGQPKASRQQSAQTSQQQKEGERAQKEEARRKKEETKQQQKQQKEQARQQKEQLKQQQKALKEQARRQKEEAKQQKEQARGKTGVDAKQSNNGSHQSSAPSVAADSARSSKVQRESGRVYSTPSGHAVASRTPTGVMTLTPEGSHGVLQQVNSARSHMSGINQRPLPAGDVTVHPNGRLTVNAAGGRQYGVRSDGTVSSYRDNTRTVSFDRNGKINSLHTSNLEMRRGSHGQRTIVSHQADNTTLVSTGPHTGYVERNVVVGDRTYVQRTTMINQRIVTSTYLTYNYRGVVLDRFVVPAFYAPAFYSWAYYPWVVPIHFTFGWLGAPWYVGLDPYFTVYPVYPSAAFWLTDYAIGETLAASYQSQADEAFDDDNAEYSEDADSLDDDDGDQFDTLKSDATTPISPEIKDAIAEQVKLELSYDTAASTARAEETGYDEVSSVLGRSNQIFLVSSNLNVVTVDEQSCGLQPGDILKLASTPASGSQLAELRVASSKQMDCPAGVTVTVSVSDLQEMHNNFRAQVESGLGVLKASQGHGEIPAAPSNAVTAPPRLSSAGETSASSADVTTMFESQRRIADHVEALAIQSAF
jgi:hypothetical protein